MKKGKPKKGHVFTRRDFLKGFGSGTLGAAIAPKLLAQKAESIQTQEGEVPVYIKKQIKFTINTKDYKLEVEPQETLLDVLRDKLNLTGAKKMCDRGECGGCTVLLDGKPIYSCMYLAFRADGANITTIEGLAQKDKLHPLQQAFVETHMGYGTAVALVLLALVLSMNVVATIIRSYFRRRRQW